jgi:hypothetical protein
MDLNTCTYAGSLVLAAAACQPQPCRHYHGRNDTSDRAASHLVNGFVRNNNGSLQLVVLEVDFPLHRPDVGDDLQ